MHGKISWPLAKWDDEKKTKSLIFKPYLGSKQYSSCPGAEALDIQFPILDHMGNCNSSLHVYFGCVEFYPYPSVNTTLSRCF